MSRLKLLNSKPRQLLYIIGRKNCPGNIQGRGATDRIGLVYQHSTRMTALWYVNSINRIAAARTMTSSFMCSWQWCRGKQWYSLMHAQSNALSKSRALWGRNLAGTLASK